VQWRQARTVLGVRAMVREIQQEKLGNITLMLIYREIIPEIICQILSSTDPVFRFCPSRKRFPSEPWSTKTVLPKQRHGGLAAGGAAPVPPL